MRFYYVSLFSWMVYAVYGVIAIALISLMWTKVFKLKLRNPGYWILAAVALVAPWSEELWISYNFDQLCRKDAGIFISKTVEVDGFYDDTTHWWRQLKESSKYTFVESRDSADGTYWRVERDGDQVRHFRIEKPTARYQYKRGDNHTPVAHEIKRFENTVVDSQTGDVLGRYTNYRRGPYWFFISLGAPTIPCAETEAATRKYGTLIYREVIKPAK